MSSEMPEGWEEAPLGQIALLSLGKMLDQKKNKGELRPYLANVNVRWGEFDLRNLREMPFEEREFGRYGLKPGDIVMCEGGEPGRCALWLDDDAEMMIQKALHRIRPMNGVDSHYLYFALAHKGASGAFAGYLTGGGIKHLPGEKLGQVQVLVPPLDEQRRIAEVLRSADEAIVASKAVERAVGVIFHRRRAELIEKAREVWPEVLVADALRKNRGEKVKKLQSDQYAVSGRHPIVDQGARFICGYTDDDGALWPYDLPVIVFGDHTRILKYVDFPFAIGADGTQCLAPTAGIRPRYFYYALQSLDLPAEGYARHFKLLKEKAVPVPTPDDQAMIEDELAAIEATVSEARQSILKLEAVKFALSSDLLSGRVRVPA